MAQPADPARTRARHLRSMALALVLGVAGTGAVLAVTGGRIDLRAVRGIRLHYLAACLLLVVLDWLSEAVRLTMLSRALGEQVSVATVLRIVFLGAFFARITPFDSGGEPFQVYALHRNGVSLGHATAVIAIKALLHGLARVCLGVLVPVWLLVTARGWHLGRPATVAMYVGMAVYLGISLMLLLLFGWRGRAQALVVRLVRFPWVARLVGPSRLEAFLERVEGHFRSFFSAISHFGNARRGTVYAVGAISLVSWASVLFVPVILIRALGGASPVAEIAATAIIFYLAVAYAPTPGSSGASELGFATLFARFVPLPLVGVLVLLWRLFTHYLSLTLGLLVTATSLGATRRRRPAIVVAPGNPGPGGGGAGAPAGPPGPPPKEQ